MRLLVTTGRAPRLATVARSANDAEGAMRAYYAVWVCLIILLHAGPLSEGRAEVEKDPVFKGEPLRVWLRDLVDLDSFSRQQRAQETVGKFCAEVEGAIPAIMKTLKDKDEVVRWGAVRALGGCRDGAR